MYPRFLKQAGEDGIHEAIVSFKNALAVEGMHHDLYTEALGTLESGKDLPEQKIFVCEVCGNTVKEVPERCPICNSPSEKFTEIK